jgi:hypothetical protein
MSTPRSSVVLAHAFGMESGTQQIQIQGSVPMWKWIGDEGATTFSY